MEQLTRGRQNMGPTTQAWQKKFKRTPVISLKREKNFSALDILDGIRFEILEDFTAQEQKKKKRSLAPTKDYICNDPTPKDFTTNFFFIIIILFPSHVGPTNPNLTL